MARRRAGGPTSAQKRHARTLERSSKEAEYIWFRCFVCTNEVTISHNKGDTTAQKKSWNKMGPFLVCLNCKYNRGGNARRFIQMYIVLVKTVAMINAPESAATLLKEIDSERPQRGLYRKVRKTGPSSEV